jgi:hypothetical protein
MYQCQSTAVNFTYDDGRADVTSVCDEFFRSARLRAIELLSITPVYRLAAYDR